MFNIIFSTLFLNNIILNKIIGTCPFIGVSTKRKNAFSMGLAVIFVVLMSSVISWALYNYV
jgi:electron transport complex protein RnfA